MVDELLQLAAQRSALVQAAVSTLGALGVALMFAFSHVAAGRADIFGDRIDG